MSGSPAEQHRCRVVVWNVNGLRAVLKRLYGPHATIVHLLNDVGAGADVVCLQETKLRAPELAASRELALADGWDAFFSCSASPRGYSGVATFCRSSTSLPLAAEDGFSGGSAAGGGAQAHPDLEDGFTLQELQVERAAFYSLRPWMHRFEARRPSHP
jgi:AP endonuclease-2